jgi:acyl dehydratase
MLRALNETVNVVSVRASKREKQGFIGGFTTGTNGMFTTRLSVSEQAGEVRLTTKVIV